MDHAGWVREQINGRVLSALGAKVADILGIVGGGIYNAPINVAKIDWSNDRFIDVKWRGQLATYDFGHLTTLVLLCHEARIRVSVEGCGPQYMRLFFSQRQAEGSMSSRHPSIEQAVATFRAYLGANHHLIYRAPVGAAAE